MKTLIKNCQYFGEAKKFVKGHVLLDDKQVLEVFNTDAPVVADDVKVIDAQGQYLIPGFVDLQVNGGKNSFFNSDVSVDCAERIYWSHQKYGTQYMFPTLITAPHDKIIKSIGVIREEMANNPGVLGMHLEGPFLNPDRKGGHDLSLIRKPKDYELDEIIDLGKGVIKKITIAPERFKREQVEKLLKNGFIVAAGHSDATYEQAKEFFSWGVQAATHLYNAMSQYRKEAAGLVGALLDTDGIYVGVINDGVHSNYNSVKVAYKCMKGRLYFVSDASFIDQAIEEFYFEGNKIVTKNGQAYTEAGALAGSVITMQDSLKNAVEKVGIPLEDAVLMTSYIPAEMLGLQDTLGVIKKGSSSKLNMLDKDLNYIAVTKGEELIQA